MRKSDFDVISRICPALTGILVIKEVTKLSALGYPSHRRMSAGQRKRPSIFLLAPLRVCFVTDWMIAERRSENIVPVGLKVPFILADSFCCTTLLKFGTLTVP